MRVALTFGTVAIISGLAALTAAQSAPATNNALGKRMYIRCAACHTVSASGPRKVGPHLQAVVGRKAGAVAGFNYSPAMKGSKIVWTDANLDKWLQRPQSVIPGTTMAFAGMAKPEERKALIAYLKKPTP